MKILPSPVINGIILVDDTEPRDMVDPASISVQIDTIIADRLRVETDSFDDSTTLKGETLDAESLDVVELAEVIEEELGVHIPDEDLADIESVGDLKEYVKERV